jgi:tetratricopeptide (TPR) repeat protein
MVRDAPPIAVQLISAHLCECGSGLSASRCCRLNLATLGSAQASRHLAPLEEEATAAQRAGNSEQAERLVLDVLELAPRRIAALTVLYTIRKAQQNVRAATALIRRITDLDPNSFWATNELALLLLSHGDAAGALRCARHAIRLAPDNAQSHYLMGMALTEAHNPSVGEHHYWRALELAGAREPVPLANLALCLKNQGKMAEARALYEESLLKAPQQVSALLGLARLEEADRNLPVALALLDRAEAAGPLNPNVALLRAMVLGRMGRTAEALKLLERSRADSARLSAVEILEKGRLLDRMGRFDEAFTSFTAGKARLRERTGQKYLEARAQQLTERLKKFFTARRLASLPRAATLEGAAQPIFILGFPRSGTTLIEQILSAHPQIAAGDELPLIAEITELMLRILDSPLHYPEALAELWMGNHREDLDVLRDHYLRRIQQLGVLRSGGRWFTDKMPLNEMHLGLIHLLFPQAPLVHVIRHPLDVMLSVYSNMLTHGFYCAYELESAARHYVLIAELLEHYRSEIDLRYLRIRYEDIVEDTEPTVLRLLAFIGEEFDARCLAFDENRRYARTASYAQVSEKLYGHSVCRYRNYLKQLEPVIPILEPVIARLGYVVSA